MSDIKKKIKGLQDQLGLVTGKDIIRKPAVERKTPLKRTIGLSASEASPRQGILSDELATQLRARMGLGAPTTEHAHPQPEETAQPIEQVLPGAIVGGEDVGFFLYRRSFPVDHSIGAVPLRTALSCAGAQIALCACDESLRRFDPRKTCFIDTETTGLAGGAGTVAFLVGLGFFEEDYFVLEQCFMRDYDDEEPMLAYLGEQLARFEAVVSYNGKSFDLPLLRSRFVQHRMQFPLAETAHFDLVHAARRVWKKRLSDCSLGNIEYEVLGLRRHGDVPGSLIPQIWLEYLFSGDACPLKSVFYHHEMDILSLAALSGHLSQRLAAAGEPAFYHAEDQVSVIRLYYKSKDYESVVEHAGRFLESSRVNDALRCECLTFLGQACKRLGRFEEMRNAWETLHEEYPDDIAAAGELAKYLEHQERDYTAAIRVCRETLTHCENNSGNAARLSDFSMSALRGRLARLEKKAARLQAGGMTDTDSLL